MAQHRRFSHAAAVVTTLTLLALVVLAPAAAAAQNLASDVVSPSVTPAGDRPGPIALATTGLDITVPVIIGLATLVLGIAIVAWAFLRTGPAERH